MTRWSVAVGALVTAAVVAASGCGGTAGPSASSRPQPVQAGAPATAAAPDASPVAGLSPAELRAVVETEPSSRARATAGTVGQPITVPKVEGDGAGRASGRRVLRISVPGRLVPRAERATVSVAGRPVGPGIPNSRLDALVAVVLDPGSVRAGDTVTYRYGRGPVVAAGTLTVVP